MAEAALLFAVGKLGDLLTQKANFLIGVEDNLQELKRQLNWMQSFLKDAARKKVDSERIHRWISEIRELALDAEDVIDSFTIKVDAPRKDRGLVGSCACFPQEVYHLHNFGSEIESILSKLKDVETRRVTCGITSFDDEAASSTRVDDPVERRRRVSPWQPDKHVVGLEAHVDTLLQKAVFMGKEGLSVSSIVGMGGVGKSTLAKKLYNPGVVVARFECRVWVTVSRLFNPKEVMKELLLKLPGFGGDEIKKMKEASEDVLKEIVYQQLTGKRYLIVMDDVWRQQDWDCFKSAFPDEQDKASRLFITSRDNNIPSGATYTHKLGALNAEQSKQLFFKAACIHDVDAKCSPELLEVGNQILEKCNGLPLAITVMGGFLLEQGLSVNSWKMVLKEIKSYQGASKDSVNAVLELSYQDLPPHLKSCFLCLSFFKEDAKIYVEPLLQMWIAEGFIPCEGEMTMEEKGMRYLKELINRNMVQAAFVDDFLDEVQICRIHDLLHDLSIRKAMEEINFDILHEENTYESLERARHLAIHCNKKTLMMLLRNPNPHIRSLVFHDSNDTDYDDVQFSSSWKRFGSLRVMELKGLGLREVPKVACRLISLRYLKLGNNSINELPISMGCLKNLQTLDIRGNLEVKVLNVLWKLNSLRHLYLGSDIICKEPLKLDILKDLQTLYKTSTKNVVVEDLAKLVSLRRLYVVVSKEEDASKLFTSLAMLENLTELYLQWEGNEYLPIDGIVNLHHLTTLAINGRIVKLPHDFPQNLSVLQLSGTKFEEDPMPLLERLPKLSRLYLWRDAYIGQEMVIKHNGFPRLKVLHVYRMKKLRKIHIGNEAMLELKVLRIYICPKLEFVLEVRIMRNLQKLDIMGTSNETESKLKDVKYSDIISNIPSVQITTF